MSSRSKRAGAARPFGTASYAVGCVAVFTGLSARLFALFLPWFLTVLLAVMLGTVNRAVALPEDRNQAIEITADKAIRDERAGFTVYTGDVILKQGSLHIEADKITIFHDREAADRIIAEGQPARMRQQPAIDQDPVRAQAGRIVYIKSREHIELTQAASIEQDGATVTGESIKYFMAEQLVRADASSDDSDSRVQVVIPAEVIEEQRAERETDDAPEGGDGEQTSGETEDNGDAGGA